MLTDTTEDEEYDEKAEALKDPAEVDLLDKELDGEDLIDNFDPSRETFAERIYALKDIVPPSTRQRLSTAYSKSSGYLKIGARGVGLTGWYVTTTLLLLALPVAIAVEGETQFVAQEKFEKDQMQGAQQVGLRDMLFFKKSIFIFKIHPPRKSRCCLRDQQPA